MGFIIFEPDRRGDRGNEILILRLLLAVNAEYQYRYSAKSGVKVYAFAISDKYEQLAQSIVFDLFPIGQYVKIDNNRNASLVTRDTEKWPKIKEVSLGLFQQVNRAIAESIGDYIQYQNKYCVISKNLYPKPTAN